MSGRKRRTPYEYAHGLYKDRENGWIFGVCAGIAEYWGISTGVVRILAVISLWLFSGITLLAYLIAAVLFQSKPLVYAGRFAEHDFWKKSARDNYGRQS